MKYITIKTGFQAQHRWKDAPEEVSFLTNWHRHLFFVEVSVEVDHSNRAVEFFTLKKEVDAYIHGMFADRKFEDSCEEIAEKIGDYLILGQYKVLGVEVSEDCENVGGIQYGQ